MKSLLSALQALPADGSPGGPPPSLTPATCPECAILAKSRRGIQFPDNDPPLDLTRALRLHKISPSDLAARLHIKPETLLEILRRERPLSRGLAFRIEYATHIPVRLYYVPVARQERRWWAQNRWRYPTPQNLAPPRKRKPPKPDRRTVAESMKRRIRYCPWPRQNDKRGLPVTLTVVPLGVPPSTLRRYRWRVEEALTRKPRRWQPSRRTLRRRASRAAALAPDPASPESAPR